MLTAGTAKRGETILAAAKSRLWAGPGRVDGSNLNEPEFSLMSRTQGCKICLLGELKISVQAESKFVLNMMQAVLTFTQLFSSVGLFCSFFYMDFYLPRPVFFFF